MFLDELKKCIKNTNDQYNLNLKYEDIIRDIENFKNKNANILSPLYHVEDNILDGVNELDMILTFMELFYNRLVKALLNKKMTIWLCEDKRDYELRIVYLIRFLIQDCILLRNLVVIRYEYQFISVFRNLIEKIKIITLNLVDYKYSKEFFYNDSKLSDKERFYKYTRPSRVNERLKQYAQSIYNEIEETGIIRLRIDVSIIETVLQTSLEKIYSFSSKFIHSNDMNEFINYYDEGEKFNLSLSHSSSKYFNSKLSYLNEMLIINLLNMHALFSNRIPCYQDYFYEEILSSYFDILIKSKYK